MKPEIRSESFDLVLANMSIVTGFDFAAGFNPHQKNTILPFNSVIMLN